MSLSEEQLRQYREDGVVVAEGLLTDDDLTPIIAELSAWIDARARELHAAGKLTDLCEGESFERRMACLFAQTKEIATGLDIMLMRGPASFAFLHNAHLLDAVERLVGPEITCSPIQHIRAKPPAALTGEGNGAYNVPWHQDAGVTWEEADSSNIVTCWLPLVDATVENGCMEVIPGVWKDGYREHHADSGTTIRPDLMPERTPVAVPVNKGGVIFMHRYTPHRSTPNYSENVRWSLDLRYQPTGEPTGRPFHPAFAVRSRQDPMSVLTDHTEWCRLWEEALVSAKGVQAHRVK